MGELTVAEALERAADLIAAPRGWTQHVYHEWQSGKEQPCASCLAGAVMLAEGQSYLDESAPSAPSALLGFKTWHEAMDWNDHPLRTQAEVVAKLREAAQLARTQDNGSL